MKICLCLIFICFHVAIYSQNKTSIPPKTKDARSQMEKELKELEADDPQMAKQLREMMKEQPQKKAATTKIIPPKYSSPLQVIALKTPVIKPTPEQAKDRLLWYKGKKLNDSTLVTGNATVVQLKRKKNQLVIQPDGKNDIFKKIDRQLSLHEVRKSGFIHLMSSTQNGFYFYPGIVNSLNELDQIQSQFKEVVKNVIELTTFENSDEQETLKPGKGGADFQYLSEIPTQVMSAYNEVMAMLQANEPLEFPEPPGRDLDACFSCNEENQGNYYRAVDEWREKYLQYEKSLTQKAMMVSRALDKISANEVPGMLDNMNVAVNKSFDRTRFKLELLEKKYGNSINVIPLLILENLNLLRQESFTGRQTEINEQEISDKIAAYIDKVLLYIREQMPQRNYNVSFNLPLIIGLYQQKLILNGSEKDMEDMREHIVELDRFNRFKLNLSMYSSVASKDLQATALVETSSNFYVQLGMAECKYQFFIRDINVDKATEKEFYIPLLSKGGVKIQLEEDDKYHTHNYSGPTDMMAVFPYFDIDFCNDAVPDTAFISIVRYKNEISEAQAKGILKSYTIDLMSYINLLVLNPDGAEAAESDNLQAAREMIEIATTKQLPAPTGIPELDALQDKYWKVMGMRKQQRIMANTAFSNRSPILFDAGNFAKIIVDASIDSRGGNAESLKVIEGVIKLKIEHEPLPYKHTSENN
jgi:hypothetical protein